MTVGQNIKRLRKEKGLTQKQLGDKCGLADSAIRKYELGGANPKIETLDKIASVLETTTDELRGIKTMDKDYKEELIKNAEDILKGCNEGELTIRLNWIYGAIRFANEAGLIDYKSQCELCDRYHLLG